MKIIFLGTDYYSSLALTSLLEKACVTIGLVITGNRTQTLPFAYQTVSEIAQKYGLPICRVESKQELLAAQGLIEGKEADLGVVASFGFLIPPAIFNLPKFGMINIHPSLLPKYRGVAPLQQAILDGEVVSGVSIMRIDTGFDTGDIIAQTQAPLDPTDTTQSLAEKLFPLGVDLFLDVIHKYPTGEFPQVKQIADQASYTKLFSPDDAFVSFLESDTEIDRKIRAFYPKPIAWSYVRQLITHYREGIIVPEKWNTLRVKLLSGEMVDGKVYPRMLQIEGKSPITWNQFQQGYLD